MISPWWRLKILVPQAYRQVAEIKNTRTWAYRQVAEIKNTRTWAYRQVAVIKNTCTWAYRQVAVIKNTRPGDHRRGTDGGREVRPTISRK